MIIVNEIHKLYHKVAREHGEHLLVAVGVAHAPMDKGGVTRPVAWLGDCSIDVECGECLEAVLGDEASEWVGGRIFAIGLVVVIVDIAPTAGGGLGLS